jgi:hypothetical protein
MTPILEQHGIIPDPASPRIATLAQLREHAAAAGITLDLPAHPRHKHPGTTTHPS